MTQPDDLSSLRTKPFSEAVTKFEQLLSQSGRAFLIGAGCSRCAGLPLTRDLADETRRSSKLSATSSEILTSIEALFDGASGANIEDCLSELIDLLAIAERRVDRGAKQQGIVLGEKAYSAEQLRTAADQIKEGIADVISKRVSIDTHRQFVRAVQRPRRVGKPGSDEIVEYLVLNYDTAIEDALALERVAYADGLDGGVTAWWCPQTFERDGLGARVLKLHGSINWREFPDDPLPRRIAPCLQDQGGSQGPILIWPASTKYRETQRDPFAQLAERTRSVLRPSPGSQRVLVVCGYSYGDAHINTELDRGLRESEGRLTVVAFTHDDQPTRQLATWRADESVRDQVLIFASRGFFHGDQEHRCSNDLSWWKFENITRLLRGER